MEKTSSSYCQLLALPLELRVRIFGFLFHQAILQVRLVTPTSPASDSGNKIASKLSGIHCHIAIARTCKVLYHASIQALAQTAIVIIHAPDGSGNQQENLDYEIALPTALEALIPHIRHIRVQDHYRPVHLRLGNYTPLRLSVDLSRFSSLVTLTYFYDRDLVKLEEKRVKSHVEVVALIKDERDEDEFRDMFKANSERLFGPPPSAHFHRWYNKQLGDPTRKYRLLRDTDYQLSILHYRGGHEVGVIRKKSNICYDVDTGEVMAKGKSALYDRSECLVGGEWWKETWSLCAAWNRSHGLRRWENCPWNKDPWAVNPYSSTHSMFQRPV